VVRGRGAGRGTRSRDQAAGGERAAARAALRPLLPLTLVRAALRSRGALYAGLAASWAVAIGLALAAPDSAAGFGLETVTPLAYAATQPGVVCHYLKLAFWPDPLVLDYGWPLASRAAEIVAPALLLLGLGAVTVRAALKREPAGYLGLWFLLVLAPSSSLFPIQDPAFEHRMYLPLVAPIVGLVVAGRALIVRRPGLRPAVVALAVAAVAVACGLTIRRNHDYRSEVAIWSDTVAKRPLNPRANMSLGRALLRAHDATGAMPHLAEAVRLAPRYPEAHNNLGAALAEQDRIDESMVEFRTALALKPGLTDARSNLARALLRRSRFDEAAEQYRALVGERPEDADIHAGFGTALVGQGRYEPAVAEYEQALRLAPGSAQLHNNMGIALVRLGRRESAVEHFREALRLAPGFAPARENLERALRQGG
jgi:Flp pilus assembly protein TadD